MGSVLPFQTTRPDASELPRPRLLDRVREAIRLRHYSRRTEKAYVHWTRRFVLFHNKRHPEQMGGPEVTAFLSSLASDEHVAASTQNQALAALLFLYRHVLGVELPWLDEMVVRNDPCACRRCSPATRSRHCSQPSAAPLP